MPVLTHTPVHTHLTRHYERNNLALSQLDAATFEAQRASLVEQLNELSQSLQLTDDRVIEQITPILDAIGMELTELDHGTRVCHPDIREQLYHETILGQIEAQFVDYLAHHIKNAWLREEILNDYVNEQLQAHAAKVNELMSVYNDAVAHFDEDSADYDYGGPLYPEHPDIEYFDADACREERHEFVSSIPLDSTKDCMVFLSTVDFEEDGFLGDLLHEWFYDVGAYEDIVDMIDTSTVSPLLLNYVFRRSDFYFEDFDFERPGFLLTQLQANINALSPPKVLTQSPSECIEELLTAAEGKGTIQTLFGSYNDAFEQQNQLEMQRLWYYLVDFCDAFDKEKKKAGDHKLSADSLLAAIVKKYNSIQKEKSDKLSKIIKVLPTDDVTTLAYNDDQQDQPITLNLQACLHTLAYVAKMGHDALTKQGADGKTNVVTAMLCFVVSANGIEGKPTSNKQFITVPLTSDTGAPPIISIDEAFTGEDDTERTIAEGLSLGSAIAQRTADHASEIQDQTRDLLSRLIDTLSISKEKRAEIEKTLQEAPVADPHAQAYYATSDIAKSTEHRHSERSLLRSLKNPAFLSSIIVNILRAIASTKPEGNAFTIYCGAMLLYSYPNSICDPCAISLLGMSQHKSSPFLAGLHASIEASNSEQPMQLSLAKPFNMITIAGSHAVFKTDPQKFMADNHQLPCDSHYPHPPRIWLTQQPTLSIYEFINNDHLSGESGLSMPYHGPLFMSGSFNSKVKTAAKRKEAAKGFASAVSTLNASIMPT